MILNQSELLKLILGPLRLMMNLGKCITNYKSTSFALQLNFCEFPISLFSRTFSEKAHNFERTHHVESSDSLKRWKKRIPCKQGKHVVMLWAILKITCVLELYVKSLKEGRNYGFDPSLRKHSNKTSLACRVLEHVLKVG
jgi:hypothetical protein